MIFYPAVLFTDSAGLQYKKYCFSADHAEQISGENRCYFVVGPATFNAPF